MWFGEIAVTECGEGCVLAHSHRVNEGRIAKGTRLTQAHLDQLTHAGVHRIWVARLDGQDVDEDEAADRLARAAAGPGLSLSRALTGRCNLHADVRGLVEVDPVRLQALNRSDWRLTLATVARHALVEPGDPVATVKVIPFAVDEATLLAAEAQAANSGALVRIARLRPHSGALVLSRLDRDRPRLEERTISAQKARLGALGSTVDRIERCAHTTEDVAGALSRCIAAGHDPVLFIGASAVVDPADVFPAAVRAAGGQVAHIGMPVDPGNLLVVASIDGAGVFGVPGCARTARPSGFDRVLRAHLAGVALGPSDIMDLGHGGLLPAAVGPAPRPPSPIDIRGVAAIVLAAGRGTRMGGRHKVLRSLSPGGPPLVRQVVDRLQQAGVAPIVVVTGHGAAGVRAALAGSRARVAHNPHFADGLGSSLAAGAGSIDDVGAALVVLADMPDLDPAVVQQLVLAWRSGGHTIVAPVHGGRRGHPVLFDAVHLHALRACSGDVGARALLKAHPVHLVEVDDSGVLLDLDTPDEWAARQRNGASNA